MRYDHRESRYVILLSYGYMQNSRPLVHFREFGNRQMNYFQKKTKMQLQYMSQGDDYTRISLYSVIYKYGPIYHWKMNPEKFKTEDFQLALFRTSN